MNGKLAARKRRMSGSNTNRDQRISEWKKQNHKSSGTFVRLLMEIFWTFLKIGPVTFGGGYAMIPVIEREVVEKHKWITSRDVADIFAVAESIPGAIAINSATFIGYRLAGVAGAAAAMLGIMVPTFVLMIILSVFFLFFRDNPKIAAAFEAIRASIVALIAYAAVKIGKTALIDKTTVVLVALTVIVLFAGQIHPALVIVSGGLLGIVVVRIRSALGIQTKLEAPQNTEQTKYKY